MERSQLEALVAAGVLPWGALQDETFNWDLDPSIFGENSVDWNTESTAPFYPEAAPIQLDVFAPNILVPDAPVELAPVDYGGGGSVIAAAVPQIISAVEEKPMGAFEELFGMSPGFQDSTSGGSILENIGRIAGSIFGGAAGGMVSGGGGVRTITGGSIVKNVYACERGKHVAKARKGASAGKCVSNRHMNVLNPRALARSVRRLSGFQHFATKTEKVIRASFMKAGVHPTRRIGGKCGTCKKARCSCG